MTPRAALTAILTAIALAVPPGTAAAATATTTTTPAAKQHPIAAGGAYDLGNHGWRPQVKRALERLIRQHRGQGKVAVFDWDNTTQARDIGDATVAELEASGRLTPAALPPGISPAFPVLGGPATPERLGVYGDYQALGSATRHEGDPESGFLPVTWAARAMAGMTAQDVVEATARAYANGIGARDLGTAEVTRIGPAPRPFLYPGMVELYGRLLQHGYRVFVVSASNVWTVRYMAARLNEALRARFGPRIQIPLRNVIGIGLLMRDRVTGRLYKDRVLVRSNTALGRAYASLDPETLRRFELTRVVDYPVSDFWGKVANVMQLITRERPFLVAGDSSGDYANLSRALYRLWIARLDQPDYQRRIVEEISVSDAASWFVQPTLSNEFPGFVRSNAALEARVGPASRELRTTIDQSLQILRDAGELEGFFG
jgi:hypothetical protein